MISNQIVSLDCLYMDDGPDIEAMGLDCDQTEKDLAVFSIPFPCEIYAVGGTVTETCGGETTTPVFKFDIRPTAGSDAGRGDGDAGVLNLGTTEAGKFAYDDSKRGTRLYPGQEIVCQLTTAATGTGAAGHIRPCVLVKYWPETFVNLSNAVDVG